MDTAKLNLLFNYCVLKHIETDNAKKLLLSNIGHLRQH